LSLPAKQLTSGEFLALVGKVLLSAVVVLGIMQYLSIKGATHIVATIDGREIEAPIVIDGHRRGTTPYTTSLPFGFHTIWVLAPEGANAKEPMIEFETRSFIHGTRLAADFHPLATQAARPKDADTPSR